MTQAKISGAGRFAPSPSGDLHLGNLRTALLAWLFARNTNRRFLVRMEDLDRQRSTSDIGAAERQLDDLAALGLRWDGVVLHQSDRTTTYQAAIDALTERGLTYECFCTRREIAQAASAPHGNPTPDGAYPGTCRHLTEDERQIARLTRPAAIRLATQQHSGSVHDEILGDYRGTVDDVVLRRGDGIIAYQLAVVVDDAAQGIDQVVRGDDLLPSTPTQVYLGGLLGLPIPTYIHVPLAVNTAGQRLAKRDGAVTLRALRELGGTPEQVVGLLANSLGLVERGASIRPEDLPLTIGPGDIPKEPWIVDPALLSA